MASSDAQAIPKRNVALRITFPIFDADGDLVTGATGLDSEVSKDGGTFADCTNEATEIATSSGMYYLDLTSTEMDAATVAIIVKTSSAGAKTTPIVIYTEGINAIADGVLSRAISNVEGTAAFRTLAGAVAKLVNRVGISGSTLTVYKTNDTDAMGTQQVTSTPDAAPITEVNTA